MSQEIYLIFWDVSPSFEDECLVNKTEKKRKKNMSLLSGLFFHFDFFLPFCSIKEKKESYSEKRAEHTGVIQRGGVGPGSCGD